MSVPLALLLAAAARAQTPEQAVASVLARVDAIISAENGRDAREIADLDRRAAALYADVAPLGPRAVPPLGAAARDLRRDPKTRLFAVVFLGKLRPSAAFAPLADALLDGEQDADVRLAAAQGLAALEAPPPRTRRAFCSALSQPGLPRSVVDETLIDLARLGCLDPAPLESRARAFGPRPSGADLETARRAMIALARSPGGAPVRSLLALIAYFPAGSAARAAAIAALEPRRRDLPAAALPALRDALREETASPRTMLALIREVDALGPGADALFVPLIAHPDAEVLAAAAEALARRGVVRARPALEAVIAGALRDPRFAPRPGRSDPASLLARIQGAASALRRQP